MAVGKVQIRCRCLGGKPTYSIGYAATEDPRDVAKSLLEANTDTNGCCPRCGVEPQCVTRTPDGRVTALGVGGSDWKSAALTEALNSEIRDSNQAADEEEKLDREVEAAAERARKARIENARYPQ